jgi:hypothetical protein
MITPELKIISKPSSEFFIYAAADTKYFELHGKPFITSILNNTDYHVHVHLYNPTHVHREWCSQFSDRLSVSFESIDQVIFKNIAYKWQDKTHFNNVREYQMYDKGKYLGFSSLTSIIESTYYACARFIRLPEIIEDTQKCLALDIDGIIRKPFDYNLGNSDVFLYQKPSGEHLAGAILLNHPFDFCREYRSELLKNINEDNVYWFLDQIVLDAIIPSYNKGLLPMGYIDWEFNEDSAIWSAKGKRKELMTFILEQQKYKEVHHV